jgi:hypothetical protein
MSRGPAAGGYGLVKSNDIAREIIECWRQSGLSQERFADAISLGKTRLGKWAKALETNQDVYTRIDILPELEEALDNARKFAAGHIAEPPRREVRHKWECPFCHRGGAPKSNHPRCEFCDCLTGAAHDMKERKWHVGIKRVNVLTTALIEWRDMRNVLEFWIPSDDVWYVGHEGWACADCRGKVKVV